MRLSDSEDEWFPTLVPKAFHGPEDEKNAAWVCRSCNASKGACRLYEYWTLSKGGLKAAKVDVPRLASSPDKTLKLYDGLVHNLLREPEGPTVFADVSAWLEAHANRA